MCDGCILHHVVQQSGQHAGGIQAKLHYDGRNRNGVTDIFLTGRAELPGMCVIRINQGALDLRQIVRLFAGDDLSFQFGYQVLLVDHGEHSSQEKEISVFISGVAVRSALPVAGSRVQTMLPASSVMLSSSA